MATNPLSTPTSSAGYVGSPLPSGYSSSTPAIGVPFSYGPASYAPSPSAAQPATAPDISVPAPRQASSSVITAAPAVARVNAIQGNVNALSSAVKTQAAANRVQSPAPTPAQFANDALTSQANVGGSVQDMLARAAASGSQAPAAAPSVAPTPASVSPSASPAAGLSYWDPVKGAYVQGDIDRDRPWEKYGLGSKQAYYAIDPATLRAMAGGQAVPGIATGTSSASGAATVSPAAAASVAAPSVPSQTAAPDRYQGELDRLNKESDNLNAKYMADLERLRTGTIPLSESQQGQLDSIKAQFDQMVQEQKSYNESYTNLIERAGASSGRNKYAPTIALGEVKQSVDAGLAKIRDINAKALQTMYDVKTAMQQENWKAMDAAYARLDKHLLDRKNEITAMQDKIAAAAERAAAANRQMKQDMIAYSKDTAPGIAEGLAYADSKGNVVRPTEDQIQEAARKSGIDAGLLRASVEKRVSDIREEQKKKADEEAKQFSKDQADLLKAAASNSAPPSVIRAIRDAKDYASAIQAGGDYLATATGIVGEYNRYARDEKAAGKKPVSFHEYQTEDANRKVLASQVANAQGLTPAQSSTLLTITNKYQSDGIIKAGMQAEQSKRIADTVIANPENAAQQIIALYQFVKNLDQNSAVREGEVGLAMQAQSLIANWQTRIAGVFEGRPVDPEVAKGLAQAVKGLADETIATSGKWESNYRSQARSLTVGGAFDEYLQTAKSMGTAAETIRSAQAALDGFYKAHPEKRDYITKLSEDPKGYSDADILQILGVEGFPNVSGDTNAAAPVRTSAGTEVPPARASAAIKSVKENGEWGGQCGAFVHSIVSDWPYGLNGIGQKESVINVPKGSVPKVGDVVIQRIGGKYGHVAVVNAVDPVTGQITLTESNYYDKTKPETVTNTRGLSIHDPTISGYFRGKIHDQLT